MYALPPAQGDFAASTFGAFAVLLNVHNSKLQTARETLYLQGKETTRRKRDA